MACLRVGDSDEALELGGQPAAVFRPLVWDVDPNDPDIFMVPEDYLMALVAAAAARLPQPVDEEEDQVHPMGLDDQGHTGPHVFDLWPAPVHLRPTRHADVAQP